MNRPRNLWHILRHPTRAGGTTYMGGTYVVRMDFVLKSDPDRVLILCLTPQQARAMMDNLGYYAAKADDLNG